MNKLTRKKNGNYTVLSNVFLRDRGLPDDWDFSINGICAILKEGKTAVYNVIDEIKERGYCSVLQYRDDKGRILGNDYTFYEEPNKDKPETENPNMGDKTQLSKDGNEVKNKQSKQYNREKYEMSTRFIPPTIEEVRKEIEEKGYSIDAEAFIAFYDSKDWFIGKNKMKKWRSSLITWQKNNDKKSPYKKESNTEGVNDIWANR